MNRWQHSTKWDTQRPVLFLRLCRPFGIEVLQIEKALTSEEVHSTVGRKLIAWTWRRMRREIQRHTRWMRT